MINKFAVMAVILLLFPCVYGAVIQGNIFDMQLEPASDVQVTIDSFPVQKEIIKDGSYAFEIAEGKYTLTAMQIENGMVMAKAEETILINSEGEFTIDLVLFPDLSENIQFLSDIELESQPIESSVNPMYYLIAVIAAIIIIDLLILFMLRKKKPEAQQTEESKAENTEEVVPEAENEKDKERILEIIGQAGGRITQKELRKETPISEAKVSLILSELENTKKIRKIKKGRGNVIILNSEQ